LKILQYCLGTGVALAVCEGDDGIAPLEFDGDMLDFITAPPSNIIKRGSMRLDAVRLAPPVSCPSKIMALGLNYADHIRESKGQTPKSPLVFAKYSTSLIGQNDLIEWDRALTSKVDFEAELAVIVGKKVSNCSEDEAASAIFGYTCANDVSARDLQFGDGQWTRGKSLDTFCPLGPWIVTADEIEDPQALGIKCILNGKVMQNSSTREMIFKVPYLISFLSRNFTLLPGDIILTGTPHGVGAFRNPPVYMADGDEVVVEIEKIGSLKNRCRVI